MTTLPLPTTHPLAPIKRGSLYYLFFFLAAGTHGPFLYVYYKELGLTGQQIGWLAIIGPTMTLLLATAIASFADRKRWRVRAAQIAVTGVATLVFFLRFATTFPTIAAMMILMALFSCSIAPLGDSLIARMSQRYHLNYGSMRLWGSVGYASSALIFGAVWQRTGFSPMFVLGSLLFIPVIWVIGTLEEGPVKEKTEQKRMSVLFRDTGFVLLLLATFLAGIANSLSMTFEGIYVRSIGGGNFLIGMMIAFSAFSELPTMFFGTRLAQRLRGGSNTVILAYALTAAAYLGYVLVANPNVMPFFSILKGLGFGLYFTTTVRLITERTPDEWASTAQSLMTVGYFGLAPLVAGPVGGLIHDTFGPAAIFALGFSTLLLAILVLWLAKARGKLG